MTAQISSDRFNIYTSIHKALRSFLCDTLCRLGRLDVRDDTEMSETLEQLESLLDTCVSHVAHENEFLHVAIEARAPTASSKTANDHAEHLHSIAELRSMSAALVARTVHDMDAAALRLYRAFALFVADNLEHMHIEETVNADSLWAHYTDAELFVLHGRLVATLSPQEQLTTARWMIPASTPFERNCMVKDMQEQMPPEALLGVLSSVQPHLDTSGWAKLSRAVRVPQVPGLVEMV